MACQLTTGFLRGCADSVGGIKQFYVANRPGDFAVTPDASGTATDITGTGLVWYQYQPRQENSFWQEEITKDRANGTTFYQQTATIVLTKDSQDHRNEIKLLAQADLVLIVKDANDKYYLLGENQAVTLDTSTRQSGTARGDLSGYTLNFMATEPDMAIEVDLSAFSAEISTTNVAGGT